MFFSRVQTFCWRMRSTFRKTESWTGPTSWAPLTTRDLKTSNLLWGDLEVWHVMIISILPLCISGHWSSASIYFWLIDHWPSVCLYTFLNVYHLPHYPSLYLTIEHLSLYIPAFSRTVSLYVCQITVCISVFLTIDNLSLTRSLSDTWTFTPSHDLIAMCPTIDQGYTEYSV